MRFSCAAFAASAHQVELVDYRLLCVLADDLDGPQPMALRSIVAREPRGPRTSLEVAAHLLAHARRITLDDHFLAGSQSCRVHLRDRRGGQRLLRRNSSNTSPTGRPYALSTIAAGFAARERRHAILQLLRARPAIPAGSPVAPGDSACRT